MVARKSFTISELKADDGLGTFEGVLSTYGNIDRVGDVCEPGCFDASIAAKGTRFPLCWNHDDSQIVGSFNVLSTEGALRIKGKLNLAVQRAKEVYSLLKEGDVRGLSIGYTTKKATYDAEGVRHLHEVDLWEGSLTAFPANPLAEAQTKDMKGTTQGVVRTRFAKSLSTKKLTKEDRDAILALLDKAFEDEEEEEEKTDDPDEDRTEEEEKPEDKSEDEEDSDEDEDEESAAVKRFMTPEVKRLLQDSLTAFRELKKEMDA